jgi:hypothetical protein
MAIYRAILTYGYTAFRLEILEYCPPEILIEREQFYLDKFKPEYNILKVAGSSFGFKHTKDTLLKMALNNNKRQPIILTNLNTGTYKEFPLMKEAAKYLDTSHTQIRNYLIRNKPYKGYKISLGMVKK